MMAAGRSKRDPAKERFWREVVADQARSGRSVRRFCRERELAESAFYFWRGKIPGTRTDFGRIGEVQADNFDQTWTLDALGNWSAFNDDGASQTRTVNEANEIEGITGGWVTPDYDTAGNMIYAPMPGDGTGHYHLRYDAWNRLVKVLVPSEYWSASQIEYDGLNRRIEKVGDIDQGENFETREYYYNDRWQCLEEHTDDGEPRLDLQNVWSARYIDALILRDRDSDYDSEMDERLYFLPRELGRASP